MSKKCVVDYFDIRVVEGCALRSSVCSYLNSEFLILAGMLEEFGITETEIVLDLSIKCKLDRIKNEISLLEMLDILRKKKCDELYELVNDYQSQYEVIRRERGIEV